MERKIGKLKFIVFVLLIIVVIVALYLVTKNSVDEITDNNKNNSESGVEILVTKTIAPTLVATEATEREVKLFIDKNGNSIKDSGESFCNGCSGFKVLVAMIVPDMKIDNSKIATVDVGNFGKIEIDKLFNYNTVWGVIEDRNYLIPEYQFAFGDNESDIYIPVLEYTSGLQGVNANISEAEKEEQNLVIKFSMIVPAMKAGLDQNKSVYLKYSNNVSDPAKFILFRPLPEKDATGDVTGTVNSYYFTIPLFDYSPTNPENFEFVLF